LLSLYATHSIPSLCPALAQLVSIAHYCGFISH
jgi:hypothetical protein